MTELWVTQCEKSSHCDYRKYNGKLTSLLQGIFEVQAENTVWLRNLSPHVMRRLLEGESYFHERWKTLYITDIN